MDFRIHKTALVLAVTAALGITGSGTASADTITSLIISDLSLSLGGFTPLPVPTTHTSGANLVAGYQTPGWDVNIAQASAHASSIGSFRFGPAPDEWVNIYSAAASLQSGISGGGPIIGGTFTPGGAINVDVSSLFMNWKAQDMNIGFAASTGMVALDGTYTMSWSSLIVDGIFSGQTGTWTASGVVSASAVPIPATAWLLGSGLTGLTIIARRKQRKNAS